MEGEKLTRHDGAPFRSGLGPRVKRWVRPPRPPVRPHLGVVTGTTFVCSCRLVLGPLRNSYRSATVLLLGSAGDRRGGAARPRPRRPSASVYPSRVRVNEGGGLLRPSAAPWPDRPAAVPEAAAQRARLSSSPIPMAANTM